MNDRLAAALADRYCLERELGAGGMATVYLAQDLKHHRQVALKVLRPELAESLGRERFLREIRLAARLNHPHILPLYDSGEADGFLFFVMPVMAGQTLRDRLDKDQALPVDEAVRFAIEVADALDYAHRHDVVHRDIKPENILLHEGHAVVADFGIGKALAAATASQTITQVGMAVGTPAYMSPEQVSGDPLDGRSDLFALGCVLYEMLTGEMAFTGPTAQAVLGRRFVYSPPNVSVVRPAVPASVGATVARLLETAPAARHATGAQVVAALRSLETPAAVPAPATAEKSLVVLPFTNTSTDAENESFADGLTEELIADLAHVKALRVISRTSSMRLKGTDKDVRTIGRDLGVRYVLEGSVRRAGAQLRITAQLIDAPADEQRWAEKYSGTMDDVFEVQERVAREIVAALDVTLTSEEDRRLSTRPVADVRAYELYLQARQELRRFGPPVRRGLALLARARELEGDTLPLRALEALGKCLLVRSGLVPDHAPLDEAEATARAILAEDPDFAYARGVLGYALYERTGSAAAAEVIGHFQAALEQDPNDPDWLFTMGTTYLGAGVNDELEGTARRLLACDPLSPFAWLLAGIGKWFVGRPAEGLAPLRRALELDPVSPMGQWCAGYNHALCGQLAEAKQHADVMGATAPHFLYTDQLFGLIAALEGDAERALTHVRGVAGLDGHHRFHLAEVFAMAGDHEGAFAALEDSVNWFHPSAYIRTHCPFLTSLRGKPRFEAYAARAEQLTASFRPATELLQDAHHHP